jgi:DNA-binding MarR family transcriptional regulator
MDFETSQISFDCVMPSAIFFNEQIEPGSIRCYAIIRNLSKMNGYCFATNKYLSGLLSSGLSSIKRWLSSLEEHGYIEIEHVPNFQHDQRRIFISDKFKKVLRRSKNELPPVQICTTPSPKMGHIIEEYPKESNLKEEREEAQAPPPKYFLEYKRLRIDRDKEATLIGKYGYDKVYEMYDRLDEYKDINPKQFKKYACHAAVVGKWLREDAQKTTLKFSQPQKNIELSKKVIEAYPELVEKNEIQMQEMGILFCYGQVYQLILFTDFNFMIKLSGRLKKMNLELPS